MFGQLRKAQEATVVALADLAEFRDSGTGGHVRRVQLLSSTLAQRLHERGAYPDEVTPQLLEMIGLILRPDALGQFQLAHVVQQRRHLQHVALALRQQAARGPHAQVGHAATVIGSAGVAIRQRRDQGRHQTHGRQGHATRHAAPSHGAESCFGKTSHK